METRVQFTAAAEKFMRRMVRFSGTPGGGLRLVVTPGGCSGLSSSFTVESAPQPGDVEMDVNGLRVFLSATGPALLDGVTVDFADSPTQGGLVFIDPNPSACGCSSASTQTTAGFALEGLRRVARPS